jgi:hypothetical protein
MTIACVCQQLTTLPPVVVVCNLAHLSVTFIPDNILLKLSLFIVEELPSIVDSNNQLPICI